MQRVNVVLVYDSEEKKVLMCLRAKDPYKGLYNLVGGKLFEAENGLAAAYRELEEETGITGTDIRLFPLMIIEYPVIETTLEVYSGRLKKEVSLREEKNKLYWISVDEDFTDTNRFAGEGNIAHMILYAKASKELFLL